MDRDRKVYQIVGFQNSGKTTLMESIINYWSKHDLKVGTIKHHGHGGKTRKRVAEKDTDKHLNAGASIVACEGEGELVLLKQNLNWSLVDIIQFYENFSLDFILIEGYKYEDYPKAVLIRGEEDTYLLDQLSNIQAILTWVPLKNTYPYKIFSIKQKEEFIKWLFTQYN
ncbi:molybdopterin-guanine dinucleotide biosynthesis protein B [Heyndrickxia oleronia]|uniref:molybdopterin-guanine dinucleotide biosynthesis protein B n=1 Tax=Heyndrickxia oleronia TaxID=38875 RepID=UPI003753BAA5